jgi:hypothetical protein
MSPRDRSVVTISGLVAAPENGATRMLGPRHIAVGSR